MAFEPLYNIIERKMIIMGILEELEEENSKSGMFGSDQHVSISYPMGMPVLDQQLGAIYRFRNNEGEIVEERHIGLPAGTFTMFVGPSSSGKTTAAEQAAWSIVESYGEDAVVIHFDVERSSQPPRIKSVLGISDYEFSKRYNLDRETDTWEGILSHIVKLSEKKESDPGRYMYDTGIVDKDTGKPVRYYIPTAIIIDSLMSVTSENEESEKISGLTSGGREAIFRGKFYRNALRYASKYNINIIVINHYDDEMPAIGMSAPKGKELTFIPTGKIIPGGKKSKYYTSSIVLFQPINGKDGIKVKEVNGYNGVPVKTLVIKSRTSAGGTVALQEFVQEAGFDPRLTIMNLAKEKGVISGRNPSCYFSCNPDVKFDTRCFISEIQRDPEIIRTLFKEMRPILEEMIPVVDTVNDDNVINGAKQKKESRDLMRELLY